MSKATATRARPLSPHLTIYRPQMTMTMSIVHRITGVALYFGTILLVVWLMSAAISEDCFNTVARVYGSWFGKLVLFGYSWALLHHMLGGIRHFIWDTGAMMEKHTATRIAWSTLIGSVALTILVWVAAFTAGGI